MSWISGNGFTFFRSYNAQKGRKDGILMKMKLKYAAWIGGMVASGIYILRELTRSDHRCWYIHEKDVPKVTAILARHGVNNPQMANCGWSKAEDTWFVRFDAAWKVYGPICGEVNAAGIQIMQDNVGY